MKERNILKFIKREAFVLLTIIAVCGFIAGISSVYPPMPEEIEETPGFFREAGREIIIKYDTKTYRYSEFKNVRNIRNSIFRFGSFVFMVSYPIYWLVRFVLWIIKKKNCMKK